MIAKRKIERNLQNAIAAIIKREIESARRKAEDEARKLAAKPEAEKKTITAAKPISARISETARGCVMYGSPDFLS